MKKPTLIKLVSAVLLCCLGLVIAIMGLSEAIGGTYYSNYTSYEYYGGDAYTGMQQASADAANNASKLGVFASGVVSQAYIFVGLVVMLVGIYLVGCTLATAAEQNPTVVEKKEEQTDNSSENDA